MMKNCGKTTVAQCQDNDVGCNSVMLVMLKGFYIKLYSNIMDYVFLENE